MSCDAIKQCEEKGPIEEKLGWWKLTYIDRLCVFSKFPQSRYIWYLS